ADKPLLTLLREVQDSQSRLAPYQYLGLADIHALAGVGELFDTLTVFENYPIDSSLRVDAGGLRLSDADAYDAYHYPLRIVITPGPRLGLRFEYQADLLDRRSMEAVAEGFIQLLEVAAMEPDRPIGQLDILSPEERDALLPTWNDTAHASGEIAAALARHPDVAQAAVIVGHPNRPLVAYVVAVGGHVPDAVALRAHVEARLPHMIAPSAFVVLEQLPLTAGGKLDRRAMLAPELTPSVWRAPRTMQEEVLCALFA